jgi:triacylglycerol lipase
MNPLPFMAGFACKTGSLFRKTASMVNPDVWRELGFVSLLGYSLLLPKREEVVARDDDGRIPIVLVHGLGGNRGSWWPLRMFLRMNGYKRVYAFGSEDQTVEEGAARLKAFMEDVLTATGASRVDIVAHSLGGIFSRYALQRLGMAQYARTLVTLATPHQGTYAAQYANTSLTLALRPDSPVIRDLNSDDLSSWPIRFVTVSSDRDVYVIPFEGMKHPHAQNVFLPGISHSQYLLAPSVFRVVERCLSHGCVAIEAVMQSM